MKNITITLDEETAARARKRAADQDVILSRFVGKVLAAHMREAAEYEEAMRQFLSRMPVKLKGRGDSYPSRDDSHSRHCLR